MAGKFVTLVNFLEKSVEPTTNITLGDTYFHSNENQKGLRVFNGTRFKNANIIEITNTDMGIINNTHTAIPGDLYYNTTNENIYIGNSSGDLVLFKTKISHEITIQEFLTQEFLEIREGLVAWLVPSTLDGFKLKEFVTRVTTKNDNVTLQINKNGTLITGTSTTITSSSAHTVTGLNITINTGDIIQIQTTNVGATPSKGLIISMVFEF